MVPPCYALPESIGEEAYKKMLGDVFDHVYESYYGDGKSKYADPRAAVAPAGAPW